MSSINSSCAFIFFIHSVYIYDEARRTFLSVVKPFSFPGAGLAVNSLWKWVQIIA